MKFTPAKPPLTGETLDSLTARLRERGEPTFRAKQILEWLYKKRARSWDAMTNLPKPLRSWLAAPGSHGRAARPLRSAIAGSGVAALRLTDPSRLLSFGITAQSHTL